MRSGTPAPRRRAVIHASSAQACPRRSGDDAGVRRWALGGHRHRVGLHHRAAVGTVHHVLVAMPGAARRRRHGPHARADLRVPAARAPSRSSRRSRRRRGRWAPTPRTVCRRRRNVTAPSTSHSRRCVPSPSRWRSRSASSISASVGELGEPRATVAAMRVLMLSWEYPPFVIGGIAAHVDGLAQSDGPRRPRGGRDEPAAARAGHRPGTRRRGGRRVSACCAPRPTCRGCPRATWWPAWRRRTIRSSALAARLGDWRPDVVHAHDWLVAWAGDTLKTLWDKPLVATIHATERGRHGGHVPPGMPAAINAIEWWLTYQAREVIACSKFMVREVVNGFELPVEKVHLVPERRRSGAVGAAHQERARARAARRGVGPGAVREGLPGAGAGHRRTARPRARRAVHHRRTGQLPARAADPDRRRGRHRHRRPGRLRARRRPAADPAACRLRDHPLAVRAVRHRRPRGHGGGCTDHRRPHRRPGRDRRGHRRRPAVRARQPPRPGRPHPPGAHRRQDRPRRCARRPRS